MSDLIDRQAAIDAYGDWYVEEGTEDGFIGTVKQLLEGFPSAQLSTNLAEVGTDAISRQAAIDALRKMQTYKMFSGDDMLLIDQAGAMTELMLLPPAEPKRGRWILDRSGAFCCSNCMEPCAGYVMMKPRDKFCKMCGSRNEVTE